jgi:competence protein ComEC
LRCTFLAVGHGGCTVLETPDGRTLLYDTGAMAGPDVVRRRIAPYLWYRGIRHIDEVFLSHADLDHFNGLVALLERFTVAQATSTPTFAERPNEGVRITLEELRRRKVPFRTVKAGDRLQAGPVAMEVLHPPADGPEGNENARSLVLLIRHSGHSILLTGDLEGPGLQRVLGGAPVPVDVLMAPHHGSRASDPARLAEWARPKVVIASQGRPVWTDRTSPIYKEKGARFLSTWDDGAVTVRSRADSLIVETYRSAKSFAIPAPNIP